VVAVRTATLSRPVWWRTAWLVRRHGARIAVHGGVKRLSGDWRWHRWQLVQVDTLTGTLVVDAIELGEADGDEYRHAHLVTLTFLGDDAGRAEHGPGRRRHQWVDIDDGLCDALHRPGKPYGALALFQGDDTLVLAVASDDDDSEHTENY
jgi:hypothetical protein